MSYAHFKCACVFVIVVIVDKRDAYVAVGSSARAFVFNNTSSLSSCPMCFATSTLSLGAEAQEDIEVLLQVLWPAVCDPQAWVYFHNPCAGKRLRLTPTQEAACDSWIRCHSPEAFKWKSILVHVNALYSWHEHLHNEGKSLLVGLTDFCGGELEIHGETPYAVSGRMIIFDGRRKHKTHIFSGLRVTLVAFT